MPSFHSAGTLPVDSLTVTMKNFFVDISSNTLQLVIAAGGRDLHGYAFIDTDELLEILSWQPTGVLPEVPVGLMLHVSHC